MPLPEPTFDTRKYREILDEALARIPVHNPEWNNHSVSDPGITLLQLFAFMTESIIYRANRIPERNRLKFLRLLGLQMRPAASAEGLVAFDNPRGPLTTVTVDERAEVLAGKTPFSTENSLTVLPVEGRIYYKQPLAGAREAEVKTLYDQLYASFNEPGKSLSFYETKLFETPANGTTVPSIDLATGTVDGLWLGLFARKGDDLEDVRNAIANKILTVGILPALGEDGCILNPVGRKTDQSRTSLVFERPNATAPASLGPTYTLMSARGTGDPLASPGTLELELPAAAELNYWTDLDPLEAGVGRFPPALEDNADLERLITWIRVRLPQREPGSDESTAQQSVGISWVGINAAKVIQRAHIAAERLPDGTGEPDQGATLVNTPVLAEALQLSVNGEIWEQIDDLNAADPEAPATSPRLASSTTAVARIGGCCNSCEGAATLSSATTPKLNVYTLDTATGEIRFGTGIRGRRPPAGAVIQASYDYGGGVEGMVGIGSITKAPSLGSLLKVINPAPTWGGDAGETLEQAELRIPGFIRHRDRLVSLEDFEIITKSTPGVSLGRVEILSLFHPDQPNQESPGVVTVMVIPAYDPRQPRAPVPDQLFLETVCAYLEPRRLITTELHVRGPQYQKIYVSVGVEVIPGREQGVVLEAVRLQIENFLSPLTGGFEGDGWPLNKAVEPAEISAAATRVNGIAQVTIIHLGDQDGERTDPIAMTGLQLPYLVSFAVSAGDPPSIASLLGEAPAEADVTETVPVPIVPEEC